MGQKTNPILLRLGVNSKVQAVSRWYSKNYADRLGADLRAREYLNKTLGRDAGVSRIVVELLDRSARIIIHSSQPGSIIGRRGEYLDKLRQKLSAILEVPTHVSVEEVRKPELDATLVAASVAEQLERRVMFRRAMKRAVSSALRAGAQGIKIMVAGRLGGAEIARSEWYREGRIPLHTLRAEIDYALAEAHTTYGVIGVKVWIFKGEVLEERSQAANQRETKQGEQAE